MTSIYSIKIDQHNTKYVNVKAENIYEAKCYIEQMCASENIDMKDAKEEYKVEFNGTAFDMDKYTIDLTKNSFESVKNIATRSDIKLCIPQTISISYTNADGKCVTYDFEMKDFFKDDAVNSVVNIVIMGLIPKEYKCQMTSDNIRELAELLKQKIKTDNNLD